jgi:cell division protein FtsB
MHDILPGRVNTFHRIGMKSFDLTNFLFAKFKLNNDELNQELKDFNGDYDEEYKHIKIPFSKVEINLKEVDRKFIEKFSPYKQEDMLKELARAGRGDIRANDIYFMHHLHDLVSKAICSKERPVMPQEVPCF